MTISSSLSDRFATEFATSVSSFGTEVLRSLTGEVFLIFIILALTTISLPTSFLVPRTVNGIAALLSVADPVLAAMTSLAFVVALNE